MKELFLVLAGWLYELADALAAFAVFLFICLLFIAFMLVIFWRLSTA